MEEQLISFETASLAHQKGFRDVTCRSVYAFNDWDCAPGKWQLFKNTVRLLSMGDEDHILAPSQSLLQKWLREKHNIFIEIGVDRTTRPKFSILIVKYSGDRADGGFGEFETYEPEPWCLYRTWEEAMEKALFDALNLINKK